MAKPGRRSPLANNSFPRSPSRQLDQLIQHAIAAGFARPERYRDGSWSARLGRNSTHAWDVTFERLGAGMYVYITVSDYSGEMPEEYHIPIRGDADVPGYVGHY